MTFAPIIAAQSTGGRIRGTVSDPSGAAVVSAKVTLINEGTNVSRDVDTGSNGEYLLVEVPIGSYEIDVTQQGFKKYVRKGIALDLNEVISIDITLQLGTTAETVEVTGAPPVVDTTSTQLGAVVNERASTQLPLNQRDVYQLLQLQPGVQSQLGNDTFYGSDKAGVVTVNGGRGRANNYSVNGGDGNDLFANLPAIEPSPDSIEEFRVITNSFDAEYGRNSGAVVNVVTKSGTNAIHGSFYEFFRNDVLNAHPFTFFPAPKPEFRQNQFGGTLGGPIRKDKTFFFGSYEGRRIVQGIVSQPISVPTGAELTNGDFSAAGLANGVVDANGNPGFAGSLSDATVANILSTRCGSSLGAPAAAAVAQVAGGGPAVPYSSIFPNFHIPTTCFDPVALSLLQYVPGAGGSGGVQVTPNKTDRGDQFQIRVDHSLNNNQKLAIYYYFDDDNTLDPFAKFQASGATTGNFPGVYTTRTQQINTTHTWTIGSTSVNEARFSYFREGQLKFDTPTRTGSIQSSCGTGAASAFCFTGTSDTPLVNDAGAALGTNANYGIHTGLGASAEGVPFIDVGGGFTIGNNFNGQLPQTGNTYQFSDNFSKIIGNHSLKFGGDVRYQMFDQLLYFDVNGDMQFLSSPNGPVGNDLGFSDAYPNYLLGIGNSYFQGSAQHELVRSTSLYLFVQDSWKIKPNVTLNYGLRWEMNTPLTDIGKKVQTFRPGETSSIYPCTLPTSSPLFVPGSVENCDQAGVTPVGLVFPGDKNVPNALTNTYYKGFAPRLGLAWSPGWKDGLLGKLAGGPGKTSVSMGYGIFYNPIEQLVLEQFSAEPPFGGSNFISNPLLQTPYVDQSGDVFPNPFNGILTPPRGQAIDWSQFRPMTFFGEFPPNLRMQYSDQYNLTIKRQLPGDILLQAGYVGSQGHRLLASYEINPGNPTTCNQLNTILGAGTCGPFGEDSSYTIPAGSVIPAGGFQLPYNAGSGGLTVPAGVLANPITLVGIRQYSSPLCQPFTGVGCPADGNPVFSGIFTENTVAKSNYNSLQVLFQKNFNKGLQFQASYTLSKTMDNASSFESALNPLNFDATYGLSAYDARNRFVFNYVWDLPVPNFDGFKGKLLDGWELSGILTFQSGFPIRITSQDDIEELDSTDLFEFPGEPNLTAPFHTQNIRQNNGFVFNPDLFTNATVAPGTIGNAPRSICCGPGINNWDMSFNKQTKIGERWLMEFRGDVFNIWNHAQFYSVDGDVSNTGSTFGQVQHVHDPRLVQFSLKFKF
ncbi:MAG TPA: carboxypeptidase regulatory-like domain-containing protein [Candidatus Eremiobacteraceae bacterium]|nr:carboxypeptidase regulatory-like domain-containing protein [Candidatus Eremiobacteraceae bacterium]